MNLKKLIGSFNLKKFSKASRTDFGVLKVAFMVAALDGEVTDAEYRAFDALAKKCRGYTPKVAATALDEAMRSAGYLMLLGKRAKDSALIAAFIREARTALPTGFAYLSIEDVRRAVITWIAMGMSDEDYSKREKMCIEALRKLFAELKVARVQAEEAQWLQLAPTFQQVFGHARTVALAELNRADALCGNDPRHYTRAQSLKILKERRDARKKVPD